MHKLTRFSLYQIVQPPTVIILLNFASHCSEDCTDLCLGIYFSNI